ncbi:MAG: 3-hydroxybutyryl-CoA dehydrogenase [Frankiaceae bacterium]|jgi:3-hydroxybutyryl-CoA dehydrogenase|nr:3-hydroxybutyryl-CoA dehydrogenase [Frankiaceae bacterium]
MDIRTVGVVGLGTMGAGIAEVFARSGFDVVAVEVTAELADQGRARIDKSLSKARDRGRLDPADYDATLGRLTFTANRADLAGADLVVEAVPERLELKTALFDELDGICGTHTVFATNTSSLPVTRLAAATKRPDRVVGMHFFNPAPVMRLVEVVHTVLTDSAVVDTVRELATACGKTPVAVRDRAGFVANALLFGYLNDAARMAETGRRSVDEIDRLVVEATGFPMGPLTLMDLIGLDVCVEVLKVMFDETRDRRYATAPLLTRLVLAGHLGRKSGRGYYSYADGNVTPAVEVPRLNNIAVPDREQPGWVAETLVYPHLDDAVRMLDDNYASREDIDTAMRLGCGYPRGPFALLDELRPPKVADALERLGYSYSPLLRYL